MVEVFKTDVRNKGQAERLVRQIHRLFPEYRVNFDLEDCDNILRVVFVEGTSLFPILDLLNKSGFKAEILPEDPALPPRQAKLQQWYCPARTLRY